MSIIRVDIHIITVMAITTIIEIHRKSAGNG